MARRHGGFRPRVSARLTEWFGPAVQGYVNVASGGATLVSSVSFDEPTTIMRTRGQVSIQPQAVSANLDIVGAIGMALVTDEAFTAGVASMPEPFTDADWGGWFVWRSFSYRFGFSDATGLNFLNWNFEIDSKAMRRVKGGNETLVIIAESQQGAYGISTPLRVLIKNP